MARTSPTHWIGVLFLLAAAILLLITTITSPVVNHIGILKVNLPNGTDSGPTTVSFGTFGWCALNTAPYGDNGATTYCTGRHIGYKPAVVMESFDGGAFSLIGTDTADGLTHTMVLHPIVCGLAFAAFLCSIGAGVIGSLVGALIALLAWILTLVAMAIDFSLFGIIKNHVNKDGSGSHAYYSTGMWTCLTAMLLLFFGMFIVFFTCFSARRHDRGGRTRDVGDNYKTTTTTRTTRPRRFGFF